MFPSVQLAMLTLMIRFNSNTNSRLGHWTGALATGLGAQSTEGVPKLDCQTYTKRDHKQADEEADRHILAELSLSSLIWCCLVLLWSSVSSGVDVKFHDLSQFGLKS